MSTPIASHVTVIRVASTDATGNEVAGLKSITWGPSKTMLDVTDFAGGAFKSRIAGLSDGSISVSGDFDASDTGQALIRTQQASGGDLWVRFLYDGTNGYKAKCLVESFDISAAVDGVTQFSAKISMNALPVAI